MPGLSGETTYADLRLVAQPVGTVLDANCSHRLIPPPQNPRGGMGTPSRSLGLVKPTDIEVRVVDGEPWTAAEQAKIDKASAPDLFGTSIKPLESAPFAIRYQYRCAAPKCVGHDQKVLDLGSG